MSPVQASAIREAPKPVAMRVGEEISYEEGDPLMVFEKGMYIMLYHPRRIARVDEQSILNRPEKVLRNADGRSMTMTELVHHKTIVCTVTLPEVEIPGWVTAQQAATVKAVLSRAVLEMEEGFNDIQWTEEWAIRPVGKTQHMRGADSRVLVRSDKTTVQQVFCIAINGRNPSFEQSSPIVGMKVSGEVIPSELVPDSLIKSMDEIRDRALLASKAKRAELERTASHEERLREIREEAMAKVEAEAAYKGVVAQNSELMETQAKAMEDMQSRLAELAAENARLAANQKKTPGRKTKDEPKPEDTSGETHEDPTDPAAEPDI